MKPFKPEVPYTVWTTRPRTSYRVFYYGRILTDQGITELWACQHNHTNRDAAKTCADLKLLDMKDKKMPEIKEETTVEAAPEPLHPQVMEESPSEEKKEAEPVASTKDLYVVARNQPQMELAQKKLIVWARTRIKEEESSLVELEENFTIAKKNKWRTQAIANAVLKAKKNIIFYNKMAMALEAGYCIVPDMNVDLFAIRTTKKLPKGSSLESYQHSRPTFEQSTDSPPAGEGRYVSDTPKALVEHSIRELGDGKKQDQYHWTAEEFRDVDFPFSLAKPEVLELTAEAMKLKIFDEIGVLPRQRANADPMVIGRICIRSGKAWNPPVKSLNFVIAWFIDTKTL